MKTRLLLVFTFLIFLVACETEQTFIDVSEADLVGTWNLTKQSVEDGSFTVSAQGQTLTADYSASTKNIDFRFTFSKDPNKLNLDGTYTLTTTASFLGQTETDEQNIDTNLLPMQPVDWTVNGNSLYFTNSQDLPAILNITEFSGNYIKLEGDFNETETYNGDSVTIVGKIIIELTK